MDQSYAKRILKYDPDTGIFTWRERPGSDRADRFFNRMLAGRRAGCIKTQTDGGYEYRYVMVRHEGKYIAAHRLAWLWMYGEWPKGVIDHIDGDPTNNRIDNLRDTTEKFNARNARMSKRNKSGVSGVSWYSRSNSWRAQVSTDGKNRCVGYFRTVEEAAEAIAMAKQGQGYTERHGL